MQLHFFIFWYKTLNNFEIFLVINPTLLDGFLTIRS